MYFSCFGKKSTKRSRAKGRYGQMRPLYNPPPHRHPAFKNVPIFERFHLTSLQVYTAEPAENRDIFSGRWSKAAGVGPGARMRFARNASPRTTSLVTFLFGHKKVTPIVRAINCNLERQAVHRVLMRENGTEHEKFTKQAVIWCLFRYFFRKKFLSLTCFLECGMVTVSKLEFCCQFAENG